MSGRDTPLPATLSARAEVSPGRVLIVEDNAEYAANIAEALELEGHQTRTASTAREALALARSEGFDLTLLDVRLPDAVGTDTLVALREAVPFGEVIVMSGDATLESALATVRGGAYAYILKPFVMDDLLRLAGHAVGRAQLRAERERLMVELRNSEARHRTVVEASPALIVGIDSEGLIALVNSAVEHATGFSREELVGQVFAEVLVPAGHRASAWPGNEPRECPIASRAGKELRIEWRYGNADGMRYAFGLDVTDTRAMERRARVAEHLAVVGELTAGLAHEIRNPLNSALLELKVLGRRLQRAGHSDALQSAEAVKGELERLERLLGEFLWFARPRSVEPAPGDPSSPLRTVARLVAAECVERNIALETDFASDTPTVPLDEDRIRQVIFNLVRNAIEALDRNGRIVLRTRATGSDAEIQVEDDGPGIQGDPSRVFRPFHTTKSTGTGLGLTIAQRIAADHGGELRVESAPRRTVFTLTLPGARGSNGNGG